MLLPEMEEAKRFVGSLGYGRADEILNFESECKYTGWYGLSYEYCKVYEYTCSGEKYEIEFERGDLPTPKFGEDGRLLLVDGKAVYE